MYMHLHRTSPVETATLHCLLCWESEVEQLLCRAKRVCTIPLLQSAPPNVAICIPHVAIHFHMLCCNLLTCCNSFPHTSIHSSMLF